MTSGFFLLTRHLIVLWSFLHSSDSEEDTEEEHVKKVWSVTRSLSVVAIIPGSDLFPMFSPHNSFWHSFHECWLVDSIYSLLPLFFSSSSHSLLLLSHPPPPLTPSSSFSHTLLLSLPPPPSLTPSSSSHSLLLLLSLPPPPSLTPSSSFSCSLPSSLRFTIAAELILNWHSL